MLPKLVFVHGTDSSAQEYDVYRTLLPAFDVQTIDLPGHGSRAGQAFSTQAAMDVIDEAVRDSGPVVLIGHSLGGYLATRYAATSSTELMGLILLGATGDPQSRLGGIYKLAGWFSEAADRFRPRRPRPGSDAKPVGPNPAAVWRSVFNDCSAEQVSLTSCPVLIINGQFDQMRVHEKRYQRLSGAKVVEIPRGSHLASTRRPQEVAAAISRFVAELPARQLAI